MAEKNDVFVGNMTFNTTEEQLREKFSFVGTVENKYLNLSSTLIIIPTPQVGMMMMVISPA